MYNVKHLFYKVFQRKYIKIVMRFMIFEGIFLEILILLITTFIQVDLEDMKLVSTENSNWSFILNILTTVIEIVATCSDLTIFKFEYDGQSSIVEKSLELKHILGFPD